MRDFGPKPRDRRHRPTLMKSGARLSKRLTAAAINLKAGGA